MLDNENFFAGDLLGDNGREEFPALVGDETRAEGLCCVEDME